MDPSCLAVFLIYLPEVLSAGIHYKCSEKHHFACNNGECISRVLACDGTSHCYDESDETLSSCVNKRCEEGRFQCEYGACVELKRRCDGTEDCKDGSDEEEEMCRAPAPPPPTPQHRPPPPPTPQHRPPPPPPPSTATSTPAGSSGGCRLPEKSGGLEYHLLCKGGEECGAAPGAVVSVFSVIEVSCAEGVSSKNSSICTRGGIWYPPPECQKSCPGLRSDTLRLTCKYERERVDCSRPQPPGTRLQVHCRPGHRTRFDPNLPTRYWREARCTHDGSWSQRLYDCTPECGVRVPVKPQIANAPEVNTLEYQWEVPWHAALYQVGKKRPYKCGGTIVAPNAIITAAHCVVDPNRSFLVPLEEMEVGVGKLHRKLGDPKDSATEQRFKVSAAHVHKDYAGPNSMFGYDIAVLRLRGTIKVTLSVMPVCLDLDNDYTIPDNTEATVLGFGETERWELSGRLRAARLRYIGREECRALLSPAMRVYVLRSKFCAGFSKGGRESLVQQGDSGGGLTVALYRPGQQYLVGVVSTDDNGERNISIFEEVAAHREFLKEALAS